MILRIVKMEFREAAVAEFLALFEVRRQQIRAFRGCLHLELWQDESSPSVFFTCSHWDDEAALNHYRFSGLFKDTWTQTKALFAAKPEAWSLKQRWASQIS